MSWAEQFASKTVVESWLISVCTLFQFPKRGEVNAIRQTNTRQLIYSNNYSIGSFEPTPIPVHYAFSSFSDFLSKVLKKKGLEGLIRRWKWNKIWRRILIVFDVEATLNQRRKTSMQLFSNVAQHRFNVVSTLMWHYLSTVSMWPQRRLKLYRNQYG